MSRRRNLRIALEYHFVRSLLFTLGSLPRALAVGLGTLIGRIGYMLFGRLRCVGERNLRLALPELTAADRRRLLQACFANLGRMLGEFSHFRHQTEERLRRLIKIDSGLCRAQHQRRGLILLTGHIGGWELLSLGWSALIKPISFLVRPIDNQRIEVLVRRYRTKFGNRAIDKKRAAREALRVLREGGALGILADLNTQPHEGVFVPFFDHLACTTTGVAKLALKTDALVVPIWATWKPQQKRYHFHCEPPVELVRTGDKQKDVELNTARYTAELERIIRLHPDQWLWIRRRWKTRPPGEPELYDEC